MKNLENKLMFIIKESNLINLFDYEYVKEESTDEGEFAYKSKEGLLDYLVGNMPNPENLKDEERRSQFDSYLSQLKHWK